MTTRLRRIIVAPLLGVIALGAAALVGLGNPNAPHEAMLQYLPRSRSRQSWSPEW